MDETLYQAWERYNDLLFKCPQHDLNNHQKVQIFYKGLDIPSHKMVDSLGLIPMMPLAEALKSIKNIVDHSQNWYNGATTWQGSSNNSNDIAVITKRVNSLGHDMQILKENIHAIQVGCKICEGVHLTKEHHLKEDKKGKSEQLTQEILTSSMADEAKTKMRNEMKVKKEPVPFDSPNINQYDESTIPPIQFPGHLKEQEDEAQTFRTLKEKPIVEKDAIRLNDRCTTVLQSQPPPKENDPWSFTLPCLIGNSKIRSAMVDLGASINVMPFSMETHEEELELLLASDPQSSFTKIKEQSCIVNTNKKSEPFIQQLNPLLGISQSSNSSIKMREITLPQSKGIDTPVLGKFLLQRDGIRGLHESFYVVQWLLKYSKLQRNYKVFPTPYKLMHVSGAWLILGCKETFQARLVGCYTEYDEVTYDGRCCSRKQN
ncbi:hypothetical protein Tco_1005234 [Tanacetum coccineum]|uniref:Uncharacterized protein n=1 Tax=Tanacetum coccineum TaxID=301880 RepID=A0ABQ5FE58_9ASTR